MNNRLKSRLVFILITAAVFTALSLPVFSIGEESLPTEEISENMEETAATADELIQWLNLHKDNRGSLKLSANIELGDFSYIRYSEEPIQIDTGEFTIIAAGNVELLCTGLTLRGQGGENGVLRSAQGGRLSLSQLTVEAENGYPVYQEEGSGLVDDECTINGESYYAKTPFVWDWEPGIAIVSPGEKAHEVLPGSALGRVNRQGDITREEVSVNWDLVGMEDYEEARLRFDVSGSNPGYAGPGKPLCTVVYDDFPLTFTKISAQEQSWFYRVYGGFTKPEDGLPITVQQQYSFDGESWVLFCTTDIEGAYDGFSYEFARDEEEPHYWDTSVNPQIYIRLMWESEDSAYYSNVLRLSAENFGQVEDIGGNRGGGTQLPGISEPSDPPMQLLPPSKEPPQVTPAPSQEPPTSSPAPSKKPPQVLPTPDEESYPPSPVPGEVTALPSSTPGQGSQANQGESSHREEPLSSTGSESSREEAKPAAELGTEAPSPSPGTPRPVQEVNAEPQPSAPIKSQPELPPGKSGPEFWAVVAGAAAGIACLLLAVIILSPKMRKSFARRFLK